MSKRFHKITAFAAAAGISLCGGCGSGSGTRQPESEDILFTVGESSLTRSDVERLIPGGLSSADSLRMFNAIVESNLKSMLLKEVALRNLTHPEKIKQKVDDYRNRLIIAEYEKEMADGNLKGPGEKRIRAYYSSNASALVLSEPLVKGVYIKTRASGHELENMRVWMSKGDAESIDRIEKSGLSHAEEYDRFTDRWIAWHTVSEVIPGSTAGAPPSEAIAGVYETMRNGSTYLLHIAEVIPAGSVMPFEYARPIIAETLGRDDRAAYERRLTAALCRKARNEGKLISGSIDPLKILADGKENK